MLNEWLKFKNGSDIRGNATEGGYNQPVDLTAKVVEKMAKAFLTWLSKKAKKPAAELIVSVGHDCRLSASNLRDSIVNAMLKCGVNVYDCGLSSTPAMYTTTLFEPVCDGAVMITASHLPFNKNGLKFFTRKGSLDSVDIEEILIYAANDEVPLETKTGELKMLDLMTRYSKGLVDFIREKTGEAKPLNGLKIIVDASNGVGGFFVEKVLWPLGADTEGSLFLRPDGNFPNHIPNPESKEAMESICNAVKDNKADFGIIFDTDVDRAGAVFDNGKEINRNVLIALISKILLTEKKGGYIVTDSITSDGLTEFITGCGGIHHRFKRGYKNVINEAIRLNEAGRYCPLAIETSGHAALKENNFLDDGAYLIIRILIKLSQLRKEGKKLQSTIEGLIMPKEEAEIRLSFKTQDFMQYGKEILEDLERLCQVDTLFKPPKVNYEGVRASLDKESGDGWFLIRMSLHDPIMPLNIESNMAGGTKIIAKKLIEILKKYDKLDLTNLKKFIQENNTEAV